MYKLILTMLALAMAASAQVRIPGPGGSAPAAAGPAYTGQICVGGSTSNQQPVACGTTPTFSTGDEIVVGVTQGVINTATISSLSCDVGATATITWSVQSGLNLFDATNGQGMLGGVGNVTGGGTCKVLATMNTTYDHVGIIAAAFSGTSHTVDGTPAAHQNTGVAGSNGNISGSVTTASNGDLLAGIIVDTSGTAATIAAGTTSVPYTKITCDATSGANLCLEWGTQTTGAAGTQANWTLTVSTSDRTVAGIVAIH